MSTYYNFLMGENLIFENVCENNKKIVRKNKWILNVKNKENYKYKMGYLCNQNNKKML